MSQKFRIGDKVRRIQGLDDEGLWERVLCELKLDPLAAYNVIGLKNDYQIQLSGLPDTMWIPDRFELAERANVANSTNMVLVDSSLLADVANALKFFASEMTIGQRYTNEGQTAIDAPELIADILANPIDLSDATLTAVYKHANGENTGKLQPLSTKRIFKAMKAMVRGNT